MSNRVFVVLTVVVAVALSHFTFATSHSSAQSAAGGASPLKPNGARWQIHRVECSYSSDEDTRAATNTILLDAETGDSWLLWPDENAKLSYSWGKLSRP